MSAGWLWMYAGAGMMLAELLTPGFVMVFFGLAAMTVGALKLLLPGTMFDMTLTWQLALFSFFSILYLITLRRMVKGVFFGEAGKQNGLPDEFAGRPGKVTEAIRPGVPGRVEVGDAQWAATAEMPIEAGKNVKVISKDNLTMKVEEVK